MVRYILPMNLLIVSALLQLRTQMASNETHFPSISVSLPADIPSETVQISYFLIGPFGGYGNYTKQQHDLHSYEISAEVNGKAAREIRMIVYASGCEIQTFVFPLSDDSRVKQNFECKRAATVLLTGQIVRSKLAKKSNAELKVVYMAYWAHAFFGISDGLVTQFQLASVSLDPRGAFQLELPYFAADIVDSSGQLRAGYGLMVRDSKSGNETWLEPEETDFKPPGGSLVIKSHYPNGLKFKSIF